MCITELLFLKKLTIFWGGLDTPFIICSSVIPYFIFFIFLIIITLISLYKHATAFRVCQRCMVDTTRHDMKLFIHFVVVGGRTQTLFTCSKEWVRHRGERQAGRVITCSSCWSSWYCSRSLPVSCPARSLLLPTSARSLEVS